MNFQMVVILWQPNSREYYRISVGGNYFDGLLSAEAAGMVATSFVLAQLANLICHFQKDAVLIIISCLITPAGIKNMRSLVRHRLSESLSRSAGDFSGFNMSKHYPWR